MNSIPMSSNTFDYYQYQEVSTINKIKLEIEFYEKSAYKDAKPIKEYLEYLRARIQRDKYNYSVVTRTDPFGVRHEIKKMDLDEYESDRQAAMFNHPWNKLREFHKIMKIKEFINNLPYPPKAKPDSVEKNKVKLIKDICEGLKTKKFGRNKSEIVYDKDAMVIQSISCLELTKKTGMYCVEWE